jgi:hypothetical protein
MFVEGKHEGDGVCICRKKLFDVFHRFVTNVEFKFEDLQYLWSSDLCLQSLGSSMV